MVYDIGVRLTDEQIYEFCRSRYFVDDDGDSYPSEMAYGLDDDQIKDLIEDDIYALKELLNIAHKGE
jgi:hypothetical protein